MYLNSDFQSLILDIIKFSSVLKPELYHQNEQKYRFLNELRFPTSIETLHHPIETNNVMDIINCILRSGYSFPFFRDVLAFLPKQLDKTIEYSEYIEAYLFHNFIAFLLLPARLQTEINLLTILNNILVIIETNRKSIIAKKAFIYTIYIAYHNNNHSIPTSVIAQFHSFTINYSECVETQCIELTTYLAQTYFTTEQSFNTEFGYSLLSIITNLTRFDLQQYQADKILTSITPGLFILPNPNLIVYEVFQKIVYKCNLIKHLDICERIGPYLIYFVSQANKECPLDLSKHYDSFHNSLSDSFQPSPLDETFGDRFAFIMPENINDPTFDIVIPQFVSNLLEIIFSGFHTDSECMNSILSSFLKEIKLHISDPKTGILFQYFLRVAERASEVNLQVFTIDFIYTLEIFDLSVTFWTPREYFENLSTIRSNALKFIISKKPSNVFDLMSGHREYPLFVADILLRCSCMPNFVKYIPNNNISVIVESLQQHCYINPCYEVFVARKVLLNYIEEISKSDEIIDTLFQNVSFMNVFMNLIFEREMREYVFNFFNSFLKKNTDHSNIFQSYGYVMSEVLFHSSDENYLQLYLDLFSNFVEIADSISLDIFLIYKASILKNLNHFQFSKQYQLRFLKNFDFFRSCRKYPLTADDCDNILKAARVIFGNEDLNLLYSSLLHYSTGYPTEVDNPVILEPNSFRLTLELFFGTELCNQILDYTFKMCHNNKENCILCFEGGVDDYIIDEAKRFKNSEINESDLQKLKKLFDIFMELVLVKTSQKVVSKFITLLTPIKSKDGNSFVKSPYYQLYMDTLNTIIKRNYKLYGPTITIGDPSYADYKVSSIQGLSSGFSILFWVRYFDAEISDDFSPLHILTLDDRGVNKKLEVYLHNRSVKIIYDTETSIPGHFLPNQWIMISLRFLKMSNKSFSLIVSYNMEQISHFSEFNIHSFTDSTSGLMFKPQETGKKYASVEFSQLFISSNTKLDIVKQFYEMNCFSSYPNEKNLLFSFKANSVKQQKSYDDNRFTTYLLLWNLEPLLPLFTSTSFANYDGQVNKNEMKNVVRLFTMLLYNDNDQYNFTRNENIGKISYLLEQTSEKTLYLNYDLYLEIYALFRSISNLELKKKIFRDILVYMPIWKGASLIDQYKIIHHWSTDLFTHDLQIAQIVCNFSFFFPLYNLSYSYEKFSPQTDNDNSSLPAEEKFTSASRKIQVEGETSDSENSTFSEKKSAIELFKLIQDDIINICNIIASYNFTKSDFDLLFYYIYESNNDEKIMRYINLMSRIIDKSEKIKSIGLMPEDVVRFQLLFNKSNSEHFITTIIDIVINIHHKQIFVKENLSWTTESFIISLSPKYITDDIFKYLSNNSMIFMDILPLCIWCSLGTNEKSDEYQTLLLTNLGLGAQIESITNKNLLLIWCCIFIVLTKDSDKKYQMAIWVLQIVTFEHLFICLDFVAKCLNSDSDLIISDLLKKYFDNHQGNKEKMIDLIEYSSVYLFMRLKSNKMKFDNSPNRDKIKKFVDIKDIFNTSLIYKNLLVRNAKHGRNYPGIKLKNNEWLDLEFATKIYKYICQNMLVSCKNYAILIGFYLALCQKSNLPVWDANNTFIRDDSLLFQTLFYSCKERNGRTKFEILNKLNPIIESVYSLLAKNYFDSNSRFLSIFYQKVEESHNFIVKTAPRINSEVSLKTLSEVNMLQSIRSDNDTWRHSWSQLWSQLNAKCGPWDHNKKQYFKRSSKTCIFGVPLLFKVNKHPVKHLAFGEFVRESISLDLKEEVFSKNVTPQRLITKSDNFICDLRCTLIKINKEDEGVFRLFKKRIEMEFDTKRIVQIDFQTIQGIAIRNHCHLLTAIELFLDTKSYFIDFGQKVTYKKLKEIINHITMNSSNIINVVKNEKFWENFKDLQYTKKWAKGEISNYEYIVRLNFHSGRSFNNLSCYPIFPWIMSVYDNSKLDQSNPSNFRDLTLPIGAIGKERLRSLKEDFYEECHFLYSSPQSSPLTINVYNVRIEPFASKQVDLQGGHFEDPNRQMRDLSDMYKIVTKETNYTELSPEFYNTPEILLNENEFDKIPDVKLPWNCESPDHFVYLHRKLLESNYVSENLHSWIDLVWGYKQTGDEAIKANNIYDPRFYITSHLTTTSMSEEEQNNLYIARRQIGQIPPQLFQKPHPKRSVKNENPPISSPFYGKIGFGQIIMSSIEFTKNDNLKICGLTHNGSYFSFPQNSQPSSLLNLFVKPQFLSFCGSECFTVYENHVISIDLHSGNVTDYKIVVFNNMTVINGCDKFIVLGYKDSTALIINRNTKKATQLNLYRGKVTCLDISLNFGVVAIATEDGVITVADLYSGDTIRNIMVNFTVHQICITKTWGFIVTSSNDKSGQKFISCYTINGRFIRQKEVQSVADSIVTWSSTSGFDYIAVNLSGIVNFSEAFFLKFSPKYNRYSGKICRMEYSEKMKSLVVVRESGEYEIHPIQM